LLQADCRESSELYKEIYTERVFTDQNLDTHNNKAWRTEQQKLRSAKRKSRVEEVGTLGGGGFRPSVVEMHTGRA
jgi:hypothetical protein